MSKLRLSVVVIALVGAVMSQGVAADSVPGVDLVATLSLPGQGMAAIRNVVTGELAWGAVGESKFGYRILAIDSKEGRVSLNRGEKTETIQIVRGSLGVRNIPQAERSALGNAWKGIPDKNLPDAIMARVASLPPALSAELVGLVEKRKALALLLGNQRSRVEFMRQFVKDNPDEVEAPKAAIKAGEILETYLQSAAENERETISAARKIRDALSVSG